MINTPFGRGPRTDGYFIRTASASAGVPCITTLPGVFAAVRGIEALLGPSTEPRSIQEYHAEAMAEPTQVRLTFEQAVGRRSRGATGVTRVRAEVLSTRTLGAYHSLTLVAPEIAEKARPGQFLAVQMPEGREFLLRRHFAVHQASRRGGWAGTLEFVVDPRGPGSTWLSTVKAHEFLEVIGPLGTAFAYPKRHTNCLLVAEGHGAASLYFLAQELLARHKRVDMVVGAETLERVFKPIEGKRLSQTIAIVTADGTLGERGSVMDALPDMVEATNTEVLYAAAPSPTLAAIAGFCKERGIPAQVAVEERMACGIGPLPDVRRAGRPQGRQRVRPPAVLRRRAGLQPGPRALGSVALRGTDDAADAARRPAGGAIVAGVKRSLSVDLGGLVRAHAGAHRRGVCGHGARTRRPRRTPQGRRGRQPLRDARAGEGGSHPSGRRVAVGHRVVDRSPEPRHRRLRRR